MVAELLDLSSAARPELFHNRLLFSCAGVQQLQNLSAHLGIRDILNLDGYTSGDGLRDEEILIHHHIHPTFLLCCSLVDCWFRRLSISMSRWDVWPLLLLPFFSAPLPDAEGPAICVEEAGVKEVKEVCGGEAELWSDGENPGALLWWVWSSAFLFTPLRWAPAPDPIMAHSFVWSTATTTEEEDVEDEEAEVGCRTSMSSWAENFSSRLWMHPWLTAVSDCEKRESDRWWWIQDAKLGSQRDTAKLTVTHLYFST